MPARQDWRRAPGHRSRPSWATGRSSTGRRVVRRRASRPAGTRPLPSVPAGLWIGPWASTLVGAEASFYSVVVKPGPLTSGHDLADAGAHQVKHVGGRVSGHGPPQRIELVWRHRHPVLIGAARLTEIRPPVALEHQPAP